MAAAVIPISRTAGSLPDNAARFVPPGGWGFSESSYTFQATKVLQSDRYRELDKRETYYECTQHDHKKYDFDCISVQPGPYLLTQPLMGTQSTPFYVPLSQRKPCAPVRLGRQIVNAYTKLVVGEDRFPDLLCKEDKDTQDYVQGISEAADLPVTMIQVRNKAGSCGVVGVSWYIDNGMPVVEVHAGKTLHVHEWASKRDWRPKHVTKIYQYERSTWDPERAAVVTKKFWYRRDWTEVADVFYQEVEVREGVEPAWVMDLERSKLHKHGRCHLIWVQNIPNVESPDSVPDYHGQYEKMDDLDVLNSVITRGGKLNLDPTLKLKMEPEAVGNAMVRKGSDHALVTGESGDASYLELGGQSITSGNELVTRQKREILDEAECVVPDPDKIAAAGLSSVALAMLYAPMLSKRGLICSVLSKALKELFSQILEVVRANQTTTEVVKGEDGAEQEVEVEQALTLPPVVTETPVVDALGNKTDEVEIEFHDRVPGAGNNIEVQWGPPFKPNANDVQLTVQAMSTAVGGKAVLSVQTAVEVLANVIGKDPAKVMKELQDDNRQAMALNGSMFGMPGGADTLTGPEAAGAQQPTDPAAELEMGTQQEMEHTDDPEVAKQIALDHIKEDPAYYSKLAGAGVGMPSAAPPVEGEPGADVSEIALSPTDIGSIITVNEARARYGLPPWPGADGNLTLTEFKALHGSTVAMAAQAEAGTDPEEPPPAPPPAFGGPEGEPGEGNPEDEGKAPPAGAGAPPFGKGKPPFPPKGKKPPPFGKKPPPFTK